MISNTLLAGYNANELFSFCSQLALAGWVILILLPRSLTPINIIPKYIIPFIISAIYTTLILKNFMSSEGGFADLADLRLLFQDDTALLAGWIHYLAFDLFIGCWIAQNADEVKISRVIQTPILLATFILGPIGLALFFLFRTTILTMEKPNYA